MAPKLPPPANTKAVGPAWLVSDKASVAPAIDALAKDHAPFGRVYSSRRSRRATSKLDRHSPMCNCTSGCAGELGFTRVRQYHCPSRQQPTWMRGPGIRIPGRDYGFLA